MELEQRFLEFDFILVLLSYLGGGILILVVLGIIIDIYRKRWSAAKERAANVAISLGGDLINKTAYGVIFIAGLYGVESSLSYRLPINLWTWLGAVLLADLTYYWMHRCEHRVRILWAIHSVHHSSGEFDLSTSLRLSWLEAAVEWIFWIPMLLMGFDLVQVILALVLVVTYQIWLHSTWLPKLGAVERWLNTPSLHRVHHGSNPCYIDKNYGGVLLVWDQIFGSYCRECEVVRYGLATPINTTNPFKIIFFEWGNIWRDCSNSRSWQDTLGYIFRAPGWAPCENSKI